MPVRDREFNEGIEQMLYRRDEEVRLLQDQLSTLLVDFYLLKGTFEHFTEDHWHPFQRSFFRSHPCTCQGYWACLLFVLQRGSVGGEWGVVVLDKLLEEVLDEV